MFRFIRRIFRKAAAKCFDVSNFWFVVITDDVANSLVAKAKAAGYVGLIANTYDVAIASQQVRAAVANGMWSDSYSYMYFDNEDNPRIDKAVTVNAPGLCWIDCEYEGPELLALTQQQVIDAIQSFINYAWSVGLRPAIYTRKLWWETYTGNTTQFNSYPLWVADPDGVARLDITYWNAKAFGGWKMPVWKQYAFNQNISGINADLNIGPS